MAANVPIRLDPAGQMVAFQGAIQKIGSQVPATLTFGVFVRNIAKPIFQGVTPLPLHAFVKPGGGTVGFAPSPDQTMGDLYELFRLKGTDDAQSPLVIELHTVLSQG
jgi:hypothetical protein